MKYKKIIIYSILCFIFYALLDSETKGSSPSRLDPVLENVFPEEFIARMYIVVSKNNRQYEFIEYVAMKNKNTCRVTLMGTPLGTLYDILVIGGRIRVVKMLQGRFSKRTRNFLFNDVKAVFIFPPGKIVKNVFKSNQIDLESNRRRRDYNYYFFDGKDGFLSKRIIINNKKKIYEISYSNYKQNESEGFFFPENILVKNIKGNYIVEINLFYIKSGNIPDRIFERK